MRFQNRTEPYGFFEEFANRGKGESKDRAKSARSLGPPKGQKGGGGSTKDPVKQKVIEAAAERNSNAPNTAEGPGLSEDPGPS